MLSFRLEYEGLVSTGDLEGEAGPFPQPFIISRNTSPVKKKGLEKANIQQNYNHSRWFFRTGNLKRYNFTLNFPYASCPAGGS